MEEDVEKYGYLWPKQEVNDLNIELACYRDPETFNTGFSREFHFKEAFRILWPEKAGGKIVFQWNDWAELMCWAWCHYRFIAVMGHTKAGKTFNAAHFALLDYLAAPHETSGMFTTTKFASLKTRLWGDFLIAIRNSTAADQLEKVFKTTSSTNELTFMPRGDKADEKFLIQGVATDRGDTEAAKLRGLNTPRRFLIGDEAQDLADGFYMALEHGKGSSSFKGVLLTNPSRKLSKFGEYTEPMGGYGSITDRTPHWDTKVGICLHLDGRDSPNIKAKKVVNKNLLQQEAFDSYVVGSAAYWMFAVGFFPPDGMISNIWSSATLEQAKAGVIFDFPPEPCASLDPAFGGDDCVLMIGEIGRLRGGTKHCANMLKSFKIVCKVGANFAEKDYQISHEVMRICREHGVKPQNFIMDCTGNARGVRAILATEWSTSIESVEYGGSATERPLRLDDTLPADHQVKRFVTELWFRASYLARDGMIAGLGNLDKNTALDLGERIYEIKQEGDGHYMIAEPKDIMKERLGRSPDFGDALCQIGELMVRKGLLGSIATANVAIKQQWKNARKRAMNANARYDEQKEYAHG